MVDKEAIEELSTWDMRDTLHEPDGWYMRELPEATSHNMKIFMDKINELVQTVNELKENKQ